MATIGASTLVHAGGVSAGNKPPAPQVDFSYAFATPHRITVAESDSSQKTLLDLQPGSLCMSWTDDDLTKIALCIYRPTWATWELNMVPQLDGRPFGTSTWRRLKGALPALDNVYESLEGTLRLQVAGGSNAAIVRIEMENASAQERRFALPTTVIRVRHEASGQRTVIKGIEEVWERGDLKVGNRTLAFVVGADEFGATDAKTAAPTWKVPPGETVVAWFVRPYRGVVAGLPAWRQRDWPAEFNAAVQPRRPRATGNTSGRRLRCCGWCATRSCWNRAPTCCWLPARNVPGWHKASGLQ